MFDITNILEPESLSEALEMLNSNPKLKIIAGGTDVLIRLHHGEGGGIELISLRNIKGMDMIELMQDGAVSIGSMATFSQIFRNDIVTKYIPVLADAVVSIGGPQIRNVATIGGNICNGAVSADSASTLFALNALIKLEGINGERVILIQDFYEGPGKVRLKPGEILTSIMITRENYHQMYGHYIKHSNRKAMDIAMLGVAAVCKLNNGKFEDLRIALGVAAPTPIRCSEAEAYAKGLDITSENIAEIGCMAVKASKARDSWRASKEYREHLIDTLTQRAVKEAARKAGGDLNG